MLIAIGVTVGVTDVLLLSLNNISSMLKDTLDIVLTPASWYTIWNGFDNLLTKPKDVASNQKFYRKMMNSRITFTPY